MPIFEFYCPTCCEDFESLMMPHENPLGIACPHCGARGADKKISAPAGYSIKGDNSASTSPKARDTYETNRQMGKRERMHDLHNKAWGMDLGLDKAPTPGNEPKGE